MRQRLEQLEEAGLDPRATELLVVLVWLVREQVDVPESELNAARRRAMFVLAAGGDPHRDVGPDSVAVERLADELETPERQAQLARALEGLATPAEGLPQVLSALEALRADAGLAWRTFALAILADELADGS